ncbi:NADH-quinone oxidoreductase subunit L [Gordonia humi]|uniref:NADH-quinone oxidoreductase subunit L n=1 Tax=Gordonia humi TaxID=686429 RepID=A0A840EW60_9ACTN|nr:NADH-quinone oxidoreductase subunit L [Gordonia humi]MBB4135912.1 NADH-quinone oxidoreductase subunit L [Gordonia humi]
MDQALTGHLLWLIPALPAIGAAVVLIAGRRTQAWAHFLTTALVSTSAVLAIVMWIGMIGRDGPDKAATSDLYSWVPVGQLQVDFGMRLDQLSMCFVLLITVVGSLIHVYSIGYMRSGDSPRSARPDPDRHRFFAYLNLFVAAMLILVLANNYLGLYLGWEGVGVASYLLIGFWQHKPAAATAAKKAFVMNRVGDMGLAIAMMLMFSTFGSVNFDDVFAQASTASEATLTGIGFMLLLAACGKSAQVPLQAWLGDAMEGPTPVSALIHAATMVTAGVYLITRSGPLFDLAPNAQTGVVVVGAVTLLFGAIVGCAKDDIKKALAASTMSQIGYMVLAAGLGPAGYAFAIMHLLTHGFFKAGLFLGAGSIMHAMDDETDMRRFGGLWRVMPITFVTFGLGYLAIIGIPPFSGFFSKDGIIEAALAAGGARGVLLGGAAIIGAAVTAFYMTRVMVMTFFGPRRWNTGASEARGDGTGPHPHESGGSMTAPMIVLAVGSVAAGGLLAIGGTLKDWLAPVVGEAPEHHGGLPVWGITVIVLVCVVAGATVAWAQYGRAPIPLTAPDHVSPLTRAARADLYGDAFNENVVVAPGAVATTALVAVEDRGLGAVPSGIGTAITEASEITRRAQNGFVRSYALSILAGTVVIAALTLAVNVL